jgi:hypothetical protein
MPTSFEGVKYRCCKSILAIKQLIALIFLSTNVIFSPSRITGYKFLFGNCTYEKSSYHVLFIYLFLFTDFEVSVLGDVKFSLYMMKLFLVVIVCQFECNCSNSLLTKEGDTSVVFHGISLITEFHYLFLIYVIFLVTWIVCIGWQCDVSSFQISLDLSFSTTR